jgi:hypothetical protein
MYSWFTETESLTSRCKAVLEGESLAEVHYRTLLANQGEGSQLCRILPRFVLCLQSSYLFTVEVARDPQPSRVPPLSSLHLPSWPQSRKYCLTDKGSVGLVPADVQHGDRFLHFPSHQCALCHPECSDPGACHHLVGECYIDGANKLDFATAEI